MKPVVQTILTAPGGDCFPACVASILEMDLTEVPNFQGSDWQHQYHAWLAPRGLALLTTGIPAEDQIASCPGVLLPGYTILAVDSPRHPGHLHAVVALDGVVVWDPHPASTEADYSSLVWREVSYFVSLNARISIADHAVRTICHLYETGVGHAHQRRRHEWLDGVLTVWQELAYELGQDQGHEKPPPEAVNPDLAAFRPSDRVGNAEEVDVSKKLIEGTRSLTSLAEVMEKDLLSRMTGLQRHGCQPEVTTLARKLAHDLTEAARQQGKSVIVVDTKETGCVH